MPYFCSFEKCFFRSHSKIGISAHSRTCKYNPMSNGEDVERSRKSNGVVESGTLKSITAEVDKVDRSSSSEKGGSMETLIRNNVEDLYDEEGRNHEEFYEAVNSKEDGENSSNVSIGMRSNSDMQRVVETIAVNLCIAERKIGKKIVEEIIKAVNHEDFNKDIFNSKIKNFNDCRITCRNLVEKSFKEAGFSETIATDDEGKFQGKFFKRNILNLLRNQLNEANSGNFYMHPVRKVNTLGEDIFHHPLETAYARDVQGKIMHRVMSSTEMKDIWCNGEKDELESFVGMFQLYSDKSAVTMKKTGITAYPVHIIFLNFKYEAWKQIIMRNESIVAYLPVSYESEDNVWRVDNGNGVASAISRSSKLKILHNAYKIILEELNECFNSGFIGELSNGKGVKCHPVILEIAGDIPEGKDLSAVLHGNRTNCPCPRCLCPYFLLNECRSFQLRTTQQTKDVRIRSTEKEREIEKCKKTAGHRENGADILKGKSLSNVSSYFEETKLLLHNKNNNIYRSLGFESMHNFDLGISKEIKECIFNMLGSEEKVLRGEEKYGTIFKNARTSILRAVNNTLKDIQTESGVNGMNVDFSSKGNSTALNGLFSSKGITGMLEAKNWRAVDHVFPFAVSIIDRLCEEDWAPLTSIAVLYIEIIEMTVERDHDVYWTEKEIKQLTIYIQQFQELVKGYLGEYQKSHFNTIKFHFLTHVVEDIRDFADLRMLEVRFYENRHRQYKTEWERTSKRKGSEFREVITRIEEANILENVLRERLQGNGRNIDSFMRYGLVKKGEVVKVAEIRMLLEHVRFYLRDMEGTIEKKTLDNLDRKFSNGCVSFLKQVGDQGGIAFLNLLREEVHYEEERIGSYFEHTEQIRIVKSGLVRGGYMCGRDDIASNTGEIKKITLQKEVWQRYVASSDFHNIGKPKHSFIIMENGIRSEAKKQKYAVGQVRILFWHKVKGELKQFALVRYMEAVRPTDIYEKTLGCAIFRWSTDDEVDYTVGCKLIDEQKPPAPWFDIVHVDRIKSVVQMIRLRRKLEESHNDLHWSYQRFAMNRFVLVEMDEKMKE